MGLTRTPAFVASPRILFQLSWVACCALALGCSDSAGDGPRPGPPADTTAGPEDGTLRQPIDVADRRGVIDVNASIDPDTNQSDVVSNSGVDTTADTVSDIATAASDAQGGVKDGFGARTLADTSAGGAASDGSSTQVDGKVVIGTVTKLDGKSGLPKGDGGAWKPAMGKDASGSDGTVYDVSGGPLGQWLLSIDNGDKNLELVSTATGKAMPVCKLNTSDNYPSLTFSRNGMLFASNATKKRLDRIDPCTCNITPLGPTGYNLIPGITSDQGNGLVGVETTVDVLLSLDPKTGKAKPIGPFGQNFGKAGATWSDSLKAIYAIDGTSDKLYTVEPSTGKATAIAQLSIDFDSVGIELHPISGVIYACTSNGVLYSISPSTGKAAAIGQTGQTAKCNNLAAPWTPLKCPNWP